MSTLHDICGGCLGYSEFKVALNHANEINNMTHLVLNSEHSYVVNAFEYQAENDFSLTNDELLVQIHWGIEDTTNWFGALFGSHLSCWTGFERSQLDDGVILSQSCKRIDGVSTSDCTKLDDHSVQCTMDWKDFPSSEPANRGHFALDDNNNVILTTADAPQAILTWRGGNCTCDLD